MKIKKSSFYNIFKILKSSLVFIGLIYSSGSFGQEIPVSLEIKQESNFNHYEALKTINTTKDDTSKVRLLIRISHVFWRGKTSTNHWLDSVFIIAGKARILSQKLHFSSGYTESSYIICRYFLEKNDFKSAKSLLPSFFGESKVRLLLIICERTIYKDKPESAELAEAYNDLSTARLICTEIHSLRWLYQCDLLMGKYHFKQGEYKRGKEDILRIIKSCERESDLTGMAHFWSELGRYMPQTDSTYRDKIYSHGMALKYYLQAGNTVEAAYSLRDMAYISFDFNQYALATKQMLQVVEMLKSANAQVSFTTYSNLSEMYRIRGEFNKSIFYMLEALKAPKTSERNELHAYGLMGSLYVEL